MMATYRCAGLRGCGATATSEAVIVRHVDDEHSPGARIEIVLPDGGDNDAQDCHPRVGTRSYVGDRGDGTPATHDVVGVVSAPVREELPSDDARAMYEPPAELSKPKRARYRAGARQARSEAERVTTGPVTAAERAAARRAIDEARKKIDQVKP